MVHNQDIQNQVAGPTGGIPMGCTISPILFVLGMEINVNATKVEGTGIELSLGKEMPPIRAFTDDLALLNRARELAAVILTNWKNSWIGVSSHSKAKKSRNLVLRKGKLDKEFHFNLEKRSFSQCQTRQ